MRRIITGFIFFIFYSGLNGQVLDGIYVNPEPVIYQTSFSIPTTSDSLWREKLYQQAVKIENQNKSQKLPVFKDCILLNTTPSKHVTYWKNGDFLRHSFLPLDFWTHGDQLYWIGPAMLSYYNDSATTSIDSLKNVIVGTNIELEEFLQPFYLKKIEVTNKEYREFVTWVRDSLARMILGENGLEDFVNWDPDGIDPPPLNWKTPIKWDDPLFKEMLVDMYAPENERFYRRKEFDIRKFIYDYRLPPGEKYSRMRVNIYPDTLAWMRDIGTKEAEWMGENYYSNVAFDDYPVVGISWWQAVAYLDWKEKQLNQSLGQKYPGMEIELQLPTVMEWELANKELKDPVLYDGPAFYFESYDPWSCNLITGAENKYKENLTILLDSQCVKVEPVVYSYSNHQEGVLAPMDGIYMKEHYASRTYTEVINDTIIFINGDEYKVTTRKRIYEADNSNTFSNPFSYLKAIENEKSYFSYPMIAPSNLSELKDKEKLSFLPNENNLEISINTSLLKGQYLHNGVSFIAGNVSEWLLNDYDNWQHGFNAHISQLKNKGSVDAAAEYNNKILGDLWNNKNGKLIKGSNWYHDACTQGDNADAHVQRFADPDKGFCTVGFRYVVHVKIK